jgi:hypothetical protein
VSHSGQNVIHLPKKKRKDDQRFHVIIIITRHPGISRLCSASSRKKKRETRTRRKFQLC